MYSISPCLLEFITTLQRSFKNENIQFLFLIENVFVVAECGLVGCHARRESIRVEKSVR